MWITVATRMFLSTGRFRRRIHDKTTLCGTAGVIGMCRRESPGEQDGAPLSSRRYSHPAAGSGIGDRGVGLWVSVTAAALCVYDIAYLEPDHVRRGLGELAADSWVEADRLKIGGQNVPDGVAVRLPGRGDAVGVAGREPEVCTERNAYSWPVDASSPGCTGRVGPQADNGGALRGKTGSAGSSLRSRSLLDADADEAISGVVTYFQAASGDS